MIDVIAARCAILNADVCALCNDNDGIGDRNYRLGEDDDGLGRNDDGLTNMLCKIAHACVFALILLVM